MSLGLDHGRGWITGGGELAGGYGVRFGCLHEMNGEGERERDMDLDGISSASLRH